MLRLRKNQTSPIKTETLIAVALSQWSFMKIELEVKKSVSLISK